MQTELRIQKGGVSPADYLSFINTCFAMSEEMRFERLLPKLFGPGRHPEQNTLFLIEQGPVTEQIAAAVGCFPLTFSVSGQLLSAVGIGNVATRPDRRGRGDMQTLMHRAIDDMIEQKTALAVLGGRRHRYNHFGFEKCDTMRYFALTPKTVSDADPALFAPADALSLSMRPIERSDKDVLDFLHRAMQRRACHVLRERDDLYDILVSWRARPYVFLADDRPVGWALHYFTKEQLSEFDTVESALAPALLRLAVETLGPLSVALPPHRPALSAAADALAEHPMLIANECFLVLDWPVVLEAFARLKAGIVPLADGACSFAIDGLAGRVVLTLSVKDGRPRVWLTPEEKPAFVLDNLAAHRFFFAPYAPERDRMPPMLAPLLPLPLCIDEADNV